MQTTPVKQPVNPPINLGADLRSLMPQIAARVPTKPPSKRPLPPQTGTCPYCALPARVRPSAHVYTDARHHGSLVLVCDGFPACDTYVSCDELGNPKGPLADRTLRAWRSRAHGALDPLWKHGRPFACKDAAYAWMGKVLDLPPERCRIAQLTLAECQRLVEVIQKRKARKAQTPTQAEPPAA